MKVGGSTPVILAPIWPRSDATLGAQATCENSRFCKLLPGCRARQSLLPVETDAERLRVEATVLHGEAREG